MTSTKEANGNGTVPAWHAGFIHLVPIIRQHACAVFQHLSRQERAEALAEVTAVALMGYLEHLEEAETASFDSGALARSATRYVLDSGRACGRESSGDVLSPTAQHRRGFKVEHLKESCDAERTRTRIAFRTDGHILPRDERSKAGNNGNGHFRSPIAQERGRRRQAEQRLDAIDIELEAARRIQERLIPAAAPALPGFDIAGMTCPSEATGGDYFDYVPMLDECVGVVVGDVSGHGFGPALLMASTRAYLRAFAQTEGDLGELLALVNRVLALDMNDDRFVTLVLARLDPRKQSLVYISAGHPTGYVLNAAGQVRLSLPSTGPLLGFVAETTCAASPPVPLNPGELVLLLSDGVLESSAPDGSAFGWNRAVSIVRVYRDDPAALIVSNLFHAVRAFCQNGARLADDITAVVIKVMGA